MFALRLQCRHLRLHERPLPLMGAYPGQLAYKTLQRPWQIWPQRPWQVYPDYRWIFWGRQLTATLMGMAAAADGGIVITPLPDRWEMSLADKWLQQVCQLMGLGSASEP